MDEQILTSVSAGPAALALFERVGTQHAHEVFTVVASTTA